MRIDKPYWITYRSYHIEDTILDSSRSLEIERAVFDKFIGHWEQGLFEGQRLGQAFYNHFRLHRVSDQSLLMGLYEADGKKARNEIRRIFHLG